MEKVITIDGLASSGKSTLSRLLAQKLNWPWFSTGVLYRGMAYVGSQENFDEKDYLEFFKSGDWKIELTAERSLFFYKGEDISDRLYQAEIDEKSSLFSSQARFRKALIPIQRSFCDPRSQAGLILEGRDCGSLLFPKAPLKIFLKAREETRAERRAKDRNQKQRAVFQAQKARDERDQNRSFAPLIQPEGALCLDSSWKDPEELAEFVYQKAMETFSL